MEHQNQIDRATTILLVEDEDLVREVTREILQWASYCVVCARTVSEASGILCERGCDIDLLLTDMVLPDGSGRALAGSVLQRNPYLRVLYVSGYPEQIRGLEASGESCLAKPYASELLLERVADVLGRKRVVEWPPLMPACAVA